MAELVLEDLERYINKALAAFYDAGKALAEIRERKLYQAEYSNFEQYCSERWGFTKQHVSKLIMGAAAGHNIISNTPDLPAPDAEYQLRPLSNLEPEAQIQIWSTAVELAGGRPSHSHVKRVAEATKNGKSKANLTIGQKVVVEGESSRFHGQSVQVIEIDGAIAKGKTESGRIEPFLVTELQPKKPEPKQQWSQSTKADHLEEVEAKLQIQYARESLLENALYRLIVAARTRQITMALIQEAESLLR